MQDIHGLNIRQQNIAEFLQSTQLASIHDLSRHFQVSDETIRRDLRSLEQHGLVEKFHGGVRINESRKEAPFQRRMRDMADEKRRIGKAAAALIPDGATVFLDNSSTACFLARQLHKHNDLTIITLSLEMANILSSSGARHRVILPGGELRYEDQTLVGMEALNFTAQFRPSMCFISVVAVHADHGCMDFDMFEVDFKRMVMPLSERVILLTDSSKFNATAPIKVCDLADFDVMVTDSPPPGDIAERMEHGTVVVASSR